MDKIRKLFLLKNFSLYLILAAVAYNVVAWIWQILSGTDCWADGVPVEWFSSGTMLLSIFICFQIGLKNQLKSNRKFYFWYFWVLLFLLMGIEEIGESSPISFFIQDFQDDYLKLFLLLLVSVLFKFMIHLEKPRKSIITIINIGIVFTCLYVVTDLGDGELGLYEFPIDTDGLDCIEEIFENWFLSVYFVVFVLIYRDYSLDQ